MFTNDLIENLANQNYHIIDNFLPEHHVDQLRAIAKELYQQGSFQQAKIGRTIQSQQNNKIRGDEICWLDQFQENEGIAHYLAVMNEMQHRLNQAFFLSLQEFETHFALYQPGAFYKKHVDQFQTTKNRKISCVYYLNENWQPNFGGELTLYTHQDELLEKVAPIGNRFICFNSELPHEVELTHHPRYSIAGWMKTRTHLS